MNIDATLVAIFRIEEGGMLWRNRAQMTSYITLFLWMFSSHMLFHGGHHYCSVFNVPADGNNFPFAPDPRSSGLYGDSLVSGQFREYLIGWDIFDFLSETAEWNSTTLDMNQDLNVLYQVYVFRTDRKENNMAALASNLLRHFWRLRRNCQTEFSETWRQTSN